jgi:hypothetical protein
MRCFSDYNKDFRRTLRQRPTLQGFLKVGWLLKLQAFPHPRPFSPWEKGANSDPSPFGRGQGEGLQCDFKKSVPPRYGFSTL